MIATLLDTVTVSEIRRGPKGDPNVWQWQQSLFGFDKSYHWWHRNCHMVADRAIKACGGKPQNGM